MPAAGCLSTAQVYCGPLPVPQAATAAAALGTDPTTPTARMHLPTFLLALSVSWNAVLMVSSANSACCLLAKVVLSRTDRCAAAALAA